MCWLDMGATVGYDVPHVFGVSCVGFDIICGICNDSSKAEQMKKLVELFKKIRKPMPRPTEQHRDKTKYTRKDKFKRGENST